MLCSSVYETCRNTSNLAEHLRRKHPDKKFDAPSSSESNSENEESSKKKQNWGTKGYEEKKPPKQQSIRSLLKREQTYKPNNAKKIKIDEQLNKMIVVQFFPLTLVDVPEMIKLHNMQDSCYVPPNRKKLTTVLIPNLYNEIKTKLIAMLNQTNEILLS